MLQGLVHLGGLEAIGARPALEGDASLPVYHVESVWPACVGDFCGIVKVIDERRDFNTQVLYAGISYGGALVKAPGAGEDNTFLQVDGHLPSVAGMGLQYVDHKEGHLFFVLLVELLERGNLPAERGSGVAAEDKNYRLLSSKSR